MFYATAITVSFKEIKIKEKAILIKKMIDFIINKTSSLLEYLLLKMPIK